MYENLRTSAGMYWDIQEFRKAMASKTRSGQVDPDWVSGAEKTYKGLEDSLSKILVRMLREEAPHQVLDWIDESPGVGEHLIAKLLGIIGDPYIARPAYWVDRPGATGGDDDPKRVLEYGEPFIRNLDKLWAYCGVGDPSRKRKAGMSKEDAAALGTWKAKATMRVLAESCLKAGHGKYFEVYQDARIEYEGRVHTVKCPQCKGSSEIGQPWRKGHQHAAALRKVSKEILRDLWIASRAGHIEAGDLDGIPFAQVNRPAETVAA